MSVRWPWWDIDVGSDFVHWTGIVALGVNSGGRVAPEVEAELFQTDPPPEQLKAGDFCRVGVPPTVVHVTAVDHHDPPLETGRLPRPQLTVAVLLRGLSYREFPEESHLDGTGYTLHPGDGIPFTFDLLMRPYAALLPGDEVADAAGRAWRFEGPWDWTAFDGAPTGEGPEWGLVLLTRAGMPAQTWTRRQWPQARRSVPTRRPSDSGCHSPMPRPRPALRRDAVERRRRPALNRDAATALS